MKLVEVIKQAMQAGFDQYIYTSNADDWTLDNLYDAVRWEDDPHDWCLDTLTGDIIQLDSEGYHITPHAYMCTATRS